MLHLPLGKISHHECQKLSIPTDFDSMHVQIMTLASRRTPCFHTATSNHSSSEEYGKHRSISISTAKHTDNSSEKSALLGRRRASTGVLRVEPPRGKVLASDEGIQSKVESRENWRWGRRLYCRARAR
jgi:hypothetical protein